MAYEKSGEGRAAGSRARSHRKHKAPLFAAVDLGTNNCRLLVAARKRDSFVVVDSHSQIARLGEGLAATGRLSEPAMDRAIDALSKISAKLKAKRVAQVRCIATEACRRAENGAEFVARVRDETGLTFKIISGHEEAKLALAGCHNLIAPETENVLVLDIGGGSTELSLVNAKEAEKGGLKGLLSDPPIKAWTSLPIGVVTLTEAFAHLDEADAMPAMLAYAREQLATWKYAKSVQRRFAESRSHVIGTSGTITCLTGVHLGLTKYRRDRVDGQWMARADMMQVIHDLRDAGPKGRQAFPTIGTERAGLMLAGCAIVEAVWELVPDAGMRVADRGLREGLLLTMMQGPKRRRQRRRRKTADGGADAPTSQSSEGPAP
ncbi:MAG: Ppx/GppA phosphatase family protein [Pseudomonadota bacterium]